MQCLGRTRLLRRCDRNQRSPFCRYHRFQPLGVGASILAVISSALTVYDVLFRPEAPKPAVGDATAAADSFIAPVDNGPDTPPSPSTRPTPKEVNAAKQAARLNPTNVAVLVHAAKLCAATGDAAGARQYYQLASAIDPTRAQQTDESMRSTP